MRCYYNFCNLNECVFTILNQLLVHFFELRNYEHLETSKKDQLVTLQRNLLEFMNFLITHNPDKISNL